MRRPLWTILLALCVLPALFYLVVPLPSPLFSDDYSTVVTDRHGAVLRVYLNGDEQWRMPPRPEAPVPEKLRTAVLLFEDRHFPWHPGVNPGAVLRATVQNLRAGKVVSGASTITMQVARLLEPKPRTVFNKLLEVAQALKIELRYRKSTILRAYLDNAPYGGNIIGYQAAALRYFRKLPDQLTWAEAALLAVLPNAPGLLTPGRSDADLTAKRNRLLRRLHDEGHVDALTLELALAEPLPDRSHPFPFAAPHAADRLRIEAGGRPGLIVSTLDALHQQQVAAMLRRHLAVLADQGIANGAALVVETESGHVAAYAGSQDFFDAEANGQVDGVRAPRSSGSILKPFLYALAIDEGILLPESLIRDVPTYYGAFSPSNADTRYSGIVTGREALTRSLNVPATRLLFSYGLTPFYHFLKAAGVSTLFRPPGEYGLPLILGGAETTLLDMAALYRGLARGGRFAPLRLRVDGTAAPEARSLISPTAAYRILDVLREVRRPGAEYYWERFAGRQPVAWKTGTSYGQRDAWAIGVSPRWTVAVWVGNFSGEGNANLGGARSAGPLLFDLFTYLPGDEGTRWFRPPDERVPLAVCSESGFRAGEACPERRMVDTPPRMKPLRLCPYHERVFVDRAGEHRVCSLCWTPGQYRGVERLVYPPDVVQYLRGGGRAYPVALPPHRRDCPGQGEAQPLQIVYPQDGTRIWLPRDFGGEWQRVTLRAAHRDRERRVYWYLDDHYLGTSEDRHEKAIPLTSGWHRLDVVDEQGHRDGKRFFVAVRER